VLVAVGAAVGVAGVTVSFATPALAAGVTAGRVSVGSPSGMTPQNHQNEPTVAIDAHNPDFLVAGSNDYLDRQRCPRAVATQQATCAEGNTGPGAGNGVGLSGVYFSFDRGMHWTQPTYTGWTARDCVSDTTCSGHFGPIGTLPWYYESGLVSRGDPGVAVGPRPVNGTFSWANGSRVYYENLAPNFPGQSTISGSFAVAVSRLDNPTPTRVKQKSSWMPPVMVTAKQSSTDDDDRPRIWADNAASSPFFGRAYICFNENRSNGGPSKSTGPTALMVGTSPDGGGTWKVQQAAAATASGNGTNLWGLFGCSVRTDSHGVVYVFVEKGENPAFTSLPTHGTEVLVKSFDGGAHWTQPRDLFEITEPCFFIDPLSDSCVMDGYTGAREHGEWTSIDIANGAPTGADATDTIIDAWVDGGAGLNQEQALVAVSSDGARSWQGPMAVSLAGDRPIVAAPAISPNGDRVYVTYQALISPWQGSDLTSPRPHHGVFRTAPITSGGLGTWTTAYDGPVGDLRATYPGHRLREERVGDYVYAAASHNYGIGLWTDARDATVCPAIQDWRSASLTVGKPLIPAPWPLADCPARFGNTDIWAATTG
jgi:hypothetical protein